MFNSILKVIIDVSLSALVIIILLPLFLLIAILIKADTKGPVFYKQQRLGKNEKLFSLIKFRTMTHKDRTSHRQVFNDDPDVTRTGRILRRTKMDELPQLINVFLCEMAIIGPRPCLPEAKSKFGKYQDIRFRVKPGLSSLAATKGSVYLNWEQKGYYDAYYVNNRNLMLDLKIIFNTLKILIIGEEKLFGSN